MKRRKRSGFTIVELVIVIAVIGILAAILIPTFINITEQAKNASDETLVRNLNTAIALKSVKEGKNETMYDAYLDAKDAGYDLDIIRANRDGRTLVWDQDADEFLTIDDLGQPRTKSGSYQKTFEGTMHYWKVTDRLVDNSAYSLYLIGNDRNDDVTVNYGFDVGRNQGIKKITFAHNSGNALDVKIRSYSNECELIVNGLAGVGGDTVHHYANAKSAAINSVGSHSYHEHGTVAGNIILKNGRAVIEEKGTASAVVVDAEPADISSGAVIISADTSKNESVPIIVSEDVMAVIEAQSEESSTITPSSKGVITFDDTTVATVDNACYSTFADAVANMGNGATIRLFKDVSYEIRAIEIRTPTTLDLNGYDLNMDSEYGFVLFDDLTIKDSIGTGHFRCTELCVYTISGTFTNENAYIESTGSYALYFNHGVINIHGGIVKAPTYAITMFGSGLVNIYGGEIYGAVTTNGQLSDNTRTINVYDGVFHGTFYKPDGGTLNIHGGVFTPEEDCALFIRGGTTNISGGEFYGTNTSGAWHHKDGGWASNGNAIMIEGSDYPSGAPFVKITGGKFTPAEVEGDGNHKCYPILAITFAGYAPVMTGTTLPYRTANIVSAQDANFLEDDGEMYFKDSNTELVLPA